MQSLYTFKEQLKTLLVRIYPKFLLQLKNPSHDQLYYGLYKLPSLYSSLEKPNYTAAYFTLMHAPEFLRSNPSLPYTVRKDLVMVFPYALKYLSDPDFELCKEAIKKSPSLLNGLTLSSEIIESLYEWKNDLFPFIKDPQESLQIRAVKDNWKNFYLIKSPSDSVLHTMAQKLLGEDVSVGAGNRISLLNLFSEWEDIEEESRKTPAYTMTQIRFINEGFDGYPEELQRVTYFHRYRISVARFRQETGISLDFSKIDCWDQDEWKNILRNKAIEEGVNLSSLDNIPTGYDFYRFCHFETVTRMKDRAYREACSILGEKATDELQEILRSEYLPICQFSKFEFYQLSEGKEVKLDSQTYIKWDESSGKLEKVQTCHSGENCLPQEMELSD